MDEIWLRALTAEHGGIVSTADLRSCGLDARAVRRRIDAGTLIRVTRGVYLISGQSFSERSRLRAGMAAACGIADRNSAAFWHGLRRELPPTLDATVGRNHRSPRRGPFAVATRRRRLDRQDIVSVRGLLVTSVSLTVLELADVQLMDDALRTRRTTLAAMAATAQRHDHCHGLGAGRRLLAVACGDTQSEAERRFRGLLRAAGLAGWSQQHPFERWAIDFAFVAGLVAIEIDGWAYHRSHERFSSDIEKHTRLSVAGWTVLRFSWQQITQRPDEVIATVRGVLR